jgi:ATP-dependent Clp protease adaptor protein ClpS
VISFTNALPNFQIAPSIQPVAAEETELEPLYRVLIHNDDVTPMDFVIQILRRIFFVEGIAAVHIMYTAHFQGTAYVQTLPKNEAQSRIGRAQFAAGLEGYPLRFSMEPEA